MGLLMTLLRYIPYYFVPSMTFLHMRTCQGIVLRVINHVLYVKKTLHVNIETWKEDSISSALEISRGHHPYHRPRKAFNKKK